MLSSVTRTLAGTILFAINTSGVALNAEEPAAIEPGQKAIEIAVQANSDFALDMYRQLAKENEGQNVFFSPYSVSGALAMTAEGARRETASEMGNVLRFPHRRQAGRRRREADPLGDAADPRGHGRTQPQVQRRRRRSRQDRRDSCED